MIDTILTISLIFFGIAIAITFSRVAIGPSFPDRILANDTVGVNIISSIAILSILFDTKVFLDAMLVLAILSFISTISYTKFIERGVIIERKRKY